MTDAAPVAMRLLEELSEREIWELKGYRFRFNKLPLRKSLETKLALVRLFGPSLSAMASGQKGQESIVAQIVKSASDRYLEQGGNSPTMKAEIEAELVQKVAADLGDYMARNFAEALDRLVVSLGGLKAESDLWRIIETFASMAWVTPPNKDHEVKLSEVIDLVFARRWDVVWRFVGAAIVREYGSFLAELVPTDLLRSVAPGLFISTYPTGSIPTPEPSPTASQPPTSTAMAAPTS